MIGRPQKVTDDKIFAALTEVVSELGPSGITLNRVASKIGLTGPALGHRFGSKRGLMLAFAERQVDSTSDLFESHREAHENPLEALIHALVAMAATMSTKLEVANHLAMLNLDLTDDELGHSATLQSRRIRRHITDFILEAGLSESAQVADDVYVVWSGAILTWAIDGQGTLGDWLQSRLRRVVNRAMLLSE